MALQDTKAFKIGAVIFMAVILGGGLWFGLSRASSDVDEANARDIVCAETLKHYRYTPKEGEMMPFYSPYSRKRTGYPAETCYWTKDGGVKFEPTYVLLNKYIGKEGPTICPDCGREVRELNPMPPVKLMEEAAMARAGQGEGDE